MTKNGIFCIEGEWEQKLSDPSSVQHLIQFIAENDHTTQLRPIYRRVVTKAAFSDYVALWKKYPRYTIGYFAFHGDKGRLCLGGEEVSIDDLERYLGDCTGKHIVLSSCNTLAISTERLEAFREATKARSVCGYRGAPDWIESCALDTMLISSLLHYERPSQAKAWLRKMCRGLVNKYGLVIHYKTKKKSHA